MALTVTQSKLISASISFFSTLLIFKALPQSQYGLLALALIFFAFFDALVKFPESSLIRFIPTSGKLFQHKLISSVLMLFISLLLVVLVLLFLTRPLSVFLLNIEDNFIIEYEKLYLALIISLLPKTIMFFQISFLNSYKRYKSLLKITVLKSLFTLTIAVIVSYQNLQVWEYIELSAAGYSLLSVMIFFEIKKEIKISIRKIITFAKLQNFNSVLKEIFIPYSLPLLGVGFLSIFRNQLPNYVIGYSSSYDTLAIFSIIRKVTNFFHKGLSGLTETLYPKLFQLVINRNKSLEFYFWLNLTLRILIFIIFATNYNLFISYMDIKEENYTYFLYISLWLVFLFLHFGMFFNLIVQSKARTLAILQTSIVRVSFFSILLPLSMIYFGIFSFIISLVILEIIFNAMLIILIKESYLFKKILFSFVSSIFLLFIIFSNSFVELYDKFLIIS